jgi:hypothetical protein
MRKGIILVLVISLLSMSFGSVEAANSQGFEWGIGVGDRIDYRITYSQPTVTTDPAGTYDFYATIISLQAIPEPVYSFSGIVQGSSSAEYYYTNDTQIFMMPWGVVAIGNWSLATELFEAQIHSTSNVSETATDWITKQSLTYGGDGLMTTEMRFSKTDGAMNYYDSTVTNAAEEITGYVRIVRSGYDTGVLGGIDPTLLLALGAGGVIVVIVGVIIVRKKR